MTDSANGPHAGTARDVRMKGFATRSTVEEALGWVDQHATRLGSEVVDLSAAFGRVLAEAIVAPRSVPAFDRSAMDGYAVIAAETTGASDYTPLSFQVVGASMPGNPCPESVTAGKAVRIMTGAPIPSGATGVVPVEYARETDAVVQITQPVAVGKHIGRVGEDIAEGTTVLEVGRRLRPQDVGVVASLGISELAVARRPRVRIVTTGNELAIPGSPCGPFRIYDANTSILTALVGRDGAVLESVQRVEDSEESIAGALLDGEFDVALVGGGSSVGSEDFAPGIVARHGELPIHGIAMRPSSPTGMGRIGERHVFLLPGNPVSCLCAYDFFAGRCLRRLGGQPAEWPYRKREVTLQRKIASAVGRVDYCRVELRGEQCVPIAISGASILSSTTRADGFVVVPAGCEGYPEGTLVTAFEYEAAS